MKKIFEDYFVVFSKVEQIAKENGITKKELMTLLFCTKNKTMKELVENVVSMTGDNHARIKIDVSQTVKKLVTKGFIIKESSPKDKRIKILKLTEKTERLINE